ncbi:hypothetical protein IJM86_08650 [bacterium]|nr:hypothetical protein [bacterium]
MKKLVLRSEGTFHKVYQSRLTKYRNKRELISYFQIGILIIGIIICFFCFLIYVNKSSTEGRFLRSANNTLDEINFNYEIVKTKVLDLQKQNREKLNDSEKYGPSITILDTNVESITIPHEEIFDNSQE